LQTPAFSGVHAAEKMILHLEEMLDGTINSHIARSGIAGSSIEIH
jgi:hypothetical protein